MSEANARCWMLLALHKMSSFDEPVYWASKGEYCGGIFGNADVPKLFTPDEAKGKGLFLIHKDDISNRVEYLFKCFEAGIEMRKGK